MRPQVSDGRAATDSQAAQGSTTRMFPAEVNKATLCLLFFLINLFIYLFIYWLCWVFVAARDFSSCSEWGLLFVAVRGLLIAVVSLVAEHGI